MKRNFLDLGHGGNDPGAIGLNKIEEADIVLDVGLKIDKHLKSSGIDNHMSRTKDITLTLNERTNLSNKIKPNTQVSIHCNSSKNPKGKGLEIFYMSNNGKALASYILAELKDAKLYTTLRDGGLKYANHHMNREAKATSCLVELGFITNQEDLNLILKNKDKFAKAIAKGICKYNGVPFKEVTTETPPRPINEKFKNGDYQGRRAVVNPSIGVNVRYDRGTNHKVIAKEPKGHIFKLNWCKDNWVSVEGYKGNKGLGYVHTDNLTLID